MKNVPKNEYVDHEKSDDINHYIQISQTSFVEF